MPESTDNSLKTEVKAYWNRASCDTWHAQSQKFTPEYFEQIEEWRYRDQPFSHSFAQFTRYHGKRILEVGFGAGTTAFAVTTTDIGTMLYTAGA